MKITNSFRDLKVWQESMTLVEDIYKLLGSQGEVDVQAELAVRLGFCREPDYAKVADRIAQVGRMLNGLIESVQPEAWDPTTNY